MITAFARKKHKILEQLNIQADEYTDASPKGSVDEPIVDLIKEINEIDSLITTSSCSGRFSIYQEGLRRTTANTDQNEVAERADTSTTTTASAGGKGGGGRWLYVSHDPVMSDISISDLFQEVKYKTATDQDAGLPAFTPACRLIHAKFEPLILHIVSDSIASAQAVLKAAQSAGFRESGISSISSSSSSSTKNAHHNGSEAVSVMTAVRSTGLAFDSPIGYLDSHIDKSTLTVSEAYMKGLVQIANAHFATNVERTERFRKALLDAFATDRQDSDNGNDWEPADVRRERKRAEGLMKQAEKRQAASSVVTDELQVADEHEALHLPGEV